MTDERQELGNKLIEWAADVNNVMCLDSETEWMCVFCAHCGWGMPGEINHAPDCLHIVAVKLQETAAE